MFYKKILSKCLVARWLVIFLMLQFLLPLSAVQAEESTSTLIATPSATTTPEFSDSTGSNEWEFVTNTPPCLGCDFSANEVDIDNSTTINNENETEVDTNATSSASSGNNTIDNNDDKVILYTGNVQLITNIFNLINTNIIGSNYVQRAYNLAGQIIGDLDLSRYDMQQLADEVSQNQDFQKLVSEENLDESSDDRQENGNASSTIDNSLNINSTSTAAVTSTVDIEANSGENEVMANNGPVKIITGNVMAAANLFNIVNTNIIGNGWTLAIINIIGDWVGNLVLPSLTHPLINNHSTPLCQSDCPPLEVTDGNYDQSLTVENNNSANVTNKVTIDADSGSNTVSDNNGDVVVETGNTVSLTQIINQANTSILGNGWVYGLVNVTGAWQGGIYGTPDEGFAVEEHPQYFTFSYQSNSKPDFSTLLQPTGNLSSTGTVSVDNSTDIANTNQANVNNEVILHANSGANLISGNEGLVLLKTGDVTALVNIFNMVNSNYIGDNWTIALVNVIGNWQGGIYFGKPDLVLTEIAQPDPNPAVPSGYIDYYLTATNKGDAPATNVNLSADYDSTKVLVTEAEDGEITDYQVIWLVPKIDVGEIIVKHYRAQILSQLEGEEITNHSQITALEEDRNSEDNTATTLVTINHGVSVGGFGFPVFGSGSFLNKPKKPDYSHPVFNQQLNITKSADKELVYKNQAVKYKLTIKNLQNTSLYDVIVYDRLVGPNGEIASDQQWKLGEVLPNENIVIEYSINFSEQAPAGEYSNIAYADGFDNKNRYSIFPKVEHQVTLSDISATDGGQYVDISYFASGIKILGQSEEESVVITNLANDPLPAGLLVVMYDEDILSMAGQSGGSGVFQVPAIAAQQTATVQFKTQGKKITDGALLTLHYLTFGQPIVALTASYKVVNTIPANNTSQKIQSIFLVSDKISTSSAGLTGRNPQVLGYMKQFDDLYPPLTTNVSDYFWSSLIDNTQTGWFWTMMLLTLLLLELQRRWRKDNTFFSKALGFRIF